DPGVDSALAAQRLERVTALADPQPLVQAHAAVTETVLRRLVRPGDEPVERDGHVETGRGHGVSLPASADRLTRRRPRPARAWRRARPAAPRRRRMRSRARAATAPPRTAHRRLWCIRSRRW